MITCKNCIHYEKCYFEALKKSHLTGSDYREIVCIDNQIICKFFKDKSCYIELPCKAGDKVYKIVRSICFGNHIQEMTIKDFGIYANTDYEVLICLDDIFLDKSKAESKLKELEK